MNNPGALGGIKVVDFSHARAGPECTLLLADMGADVIKIEKPEGDGSRHWGSTWKGERVDFLSLNRNKLGVNADLSDPESLRIVKELVADADVVVQNFRPGVMDKYGLGPDQLLAEHPSLIYVTISGYGANGPLAGNRCYDQVIQGFSGFMGVTGTEESGPVRAGIPLADLLGGVFAALGVSSALYERERSGKGQHVQTSLLQSLVGMMSFHALEYLLNGNDAQLAGNHHPTIAPTGTFAARNGSLTIAIANDAMWRRFCTLIGGEELVTDDRFRTNNDRRSNLTALVAEIEKRMAVKDKEDWVAELTAAGVPSGPVHTVGEAMDHAQVRANDLVVDVDHPTLGTMSMLGFPFQLSRTPLSARTAPPALGEHNARFGFPALEQEAAQ